jgi:hypothetical protein
VQDAATSNSAIVLTAGNAAVFMGSGAGFVAGGELGV